MKRVIATVLVALMLSAGASAVLAEDREPQSLYTAYNEYDEYEDAFSNPLRLAYYLAYPIGFTAEWLIMRPFHFLISRPYLSNVFGYKPIGEEGVYSRMGEHM
jgi:hypothetical protein